MTLVKLKMRSIYKSFLVFIGIIILLMLSIGVYYFIIDRSPKSSADIIVMGDLSVNYIDGKEFSMEDNKIMKLSITNNSDHVNYYTLGFTKVRGSGTYKIIYNNTLVTEGELKSIDEINTDYLSIDAYETKVYILNITTDNNLKGILNIRNQEDKTTTFADVILKNTPPVNDSKTKIGSEIATDNEGLIKSTDDIGVSYYYRGNINSNYVQFADLTWRIVRINGDGTVRLILDGETPTIGAYYTNDNNNFEFEISNMKTILDNWLKDNLITYKDYIATGRYCSDIEYDDNKKYYADTRILTNKLPILSCLGTIVRNDIGLLSIDEVILAGANTKDINQSYYLYNSSISNEWYTLSAVNGSDKNINMFMVNTNGSINTMVDANLNRSIRPVINLIKNVEVSGVGTIDDPYIIKE